MKAVGRLRFTAAAAVVLALNAAILAAGGSAAGYAASALGCKLAGVRYVGAAAGKAKVCFTLTANLKTMREHAYEPCAASDVVISQSRVAKPVAVRANGTFTTTRGDLAAGGAGLGFVNLTFSGRIQGSRASGTLLLRAVDTGSTFRCTWTARRTSR